MRFNVLLAAVDFAADVKQNMLASIVRSFKHESGKRPSKILLNVNSKSSRCRKVGRIVRNARQYANELRAAIT